MDRRKFIQSAAAASLALGGLGSLAIERHRLEITTTRLALGLPKPLRVAALGDIHFDPLYEVDYLQHVMSQVAALRPDLILYTGDFISHGPSRIHELAEILASVEAPLGTHAVLGNHDEWHAPRSVVRALESSGIPVLRNRSIPLDGCDNVYLTGLNSYWASRVDLRCLAETPKDSSHLLVVHEPDPFSFLTDPRIKLQISGHTHGGQVRLPLVGPLRLPAWGKLYVQGHFQKDDRHLYVNRGIGTLAPFVRVDCRPEISLLELS